MKKLFTFLIALFLFFGMGYAQIATFPWSEGFENNGTSFPTGWTQEQIVGSVNWTIAGYQMHSGSYRAGFSSFTKGHKTKLVAPPMDISGVANPVLKFWHVQALSWGAQNKLRIYYKTSAGGAWTLLEEYTSNVADWTLRQLSLPAPSADYYIAFEAESDGDGDVKLDDIVVAPAPTGPVIGENPTSLDFGNVYNNVTFGKYTKTYTIQNTGIADLTVSAVSSALTNSRITVAGLPVTVAPNGQENITVELDAYGLPVGFFSGDLVLESNDPATPEFTISVKAASKAAAISSYIYETFANGEPANWTDGRFMINLYDGIDNSPCIGVTLFQPATMPDYAKETVQTNYVSMGANPVLSFYYRVLQQPAGGFDYIDPVAANHFTYFVSISKDDGKTWNYVTTTPNGSHTPSVDYALITANVSAYANELCLVRITLQALGTAPGTKAWLDNIIIGTAPAHELAAVSVIGTATPTANIAENYTVRVKNLGAATQSSYTVRLMKKGDTDTEIAGKPGVPIAQNETKDFVLEWTPDAEGAAILYGEVVFAEDEFTGNNKTGEFPITVQPNTFRNITVGTGTDKYYYLPYNTYYLQSLTQSLYFPHELKTNGGEIRSLTYEAEIFQGVANLQNVGIQIWMGETDRKNLQDGWIDPSTLTLVYDGALDFPVGKYNVTVNLDNPYQYNGGTLVIYSFKQKISDDGYGNIQNGFTSTKYPLSSRSRSNFLTDLEPFDPADPESSVAISMALDFMPNTDFVFDFEGMGALQGLVDNGTDPLDEANVQIIGTGLYVLTNAEGNYELPYLTPGNYRIEVSKHGYFSDTLDITVTADNIEIQNATLAAIPTYTVSGKVTGSNAPDGLQNVEVSLSGYESYATATDALGNYSIPGVYENNIYHVQAKLALYTTYQSTVEVASANATHNLTLTETPYPVFSATAATSGNNAVVTWEAPVAAEEKTYVLDDGTTEDAHGINPNVLHWLGNKYVVSESGVLKSIDLLGTAQAGSSDRTVTIDIFNENQELMGSSEPFRIPDNDWINVPVNNIPYSGTFYVMLKWPATSGTTNWLAADDNGPNIRERLSMHYDGTNWGTFYSATGRHEVFLIRPNAAIVDESVTPTPVDYVIYRLSEGAPETSWTQLGTATAATYTDTDWIMLSDDVYQYAVKAEYAANNPSKSILTNTLTKVNVPPVLTNVTVNGASITAADNMYYMAACNETSVVLQLNATGAPSITSGGSTYSAGAAIPLTGEKTPITIKLVAGTYTVSYTLTASQALGSATTPMYVQRWGKTLAVVNNPANNGGHAFNEYKWYHNGILQDNDHGYILLNNRPATEYAAEVNSTKTGVWHKLCPNVKSQVQNEIVAYPNPVGAGQLLNLNLPEGTDKVNVRIYDMSGNLIRQQNGVHSAVTAPNQAGVYVIRIELPDGNVAIQNILVE